MKRDQKLRLKVVHICIAASDEFDQLRGVSVRSVQMDMKKMYFLVISCLEIEHIELTPVNPLKFSFTVLPKLLKKWHLILVLVI